jgi:hypothetical protein
MGRTKKILALRAGGPADRLHALDPKRFDDGAGHAGLLNHEELKDVQRNEKYKWHPSTVAQESLRLQNGNNTNKALTRKVTKFHEGKLEFVEGLLQLVRYTQPLRHLHRVFVFFVCHGSGAFEFVPGERLAGNSAQKCFE